MSLLPTAPRRPRGKPTETAGATYLAGRPAPCRSEEVRRWELSVLTPFLSSTGPWCNGSTSDFDSLGLGSTPSGPANQQLQAFAKGFFALRKYVAPA